MSFKCWSVGDNTYGQQGTSTFFSQSSPIIINALSHTANIKNIVTSHQGGLYILYNDGKLKVCGHNNCGQLGLGTDIFARIICRCWSKLLMIPTDIIGLILSFGGKPTLLTDMVKDRQSKPLTITHFNIKHIFTGIVSCHTFILTNNNLIYGVGQNCYNQLGIQTATSYIYDFNRVDYFQNIKCIIKKIGCTTQTTIYLDKNGKLFVSGYSSCGALGLDADTKKVDKITEIKLKCKIIDICCGGWHCLALTNDYKLYSWGHNIFGECGHGSITNIYKPKLLKYLLNNNIKITQIKSGKYHNVILNDKGKVYCFGYNKHYQCGDSTDIAVKEVTINETLKNMIIIDIQCGSEHNVVCTNHNQYYLWGLNDKKQCLVNLNEYVKVPTKYIFEKHFGNDCNILNVYAGWKETRIITN